MPNKCSLFLELNNANTFNSTINACIRTVNVIRSTKIKTNPNTSNSTINPSITTQMCLGYHRIPRHIRVDTRVTTKT